MSANSVLDAIVKAYDVRGTFPDELNADITRALGVAFAEFTGADRILVGRDMRASGVGLVGAFAEGVCSRGVDVVDLGMVSTDLVYFAAGKLDAPGAMFTASHNPAQYNGVKFCLPGARPVGADSGLAEVKALAEAVLAGSGPGPAPTAGRTIERDLLDEFADHVVSFIDVESIAPL
jgi:phosphomannomutase